MHIQCEATDVNFILGAYVDRDVTGKTVELNNAKCCMKQKCGAYVTEKTMAKLDKLECP